MPPAVDSARFHQHVGGLAAMRAGIHAQRAADRARDAAVEGEPVETGLGGRLGEAHVGNRGAHGQRVAVDRDAAERLAAEPDHHARHPAVADDQVRAETDDRDRHVGVQGGEEAREILLVGRGEQDLGGAADPEPGEVGQRLVGEQAPAKIGRGGADTVVEGCGHLWISPLPACGERDATTVSSHRGGSRG